MLLISNEIANVNANKVVQETNKDFQETKKDVQETNEVVQEINKVTDNDEIIEEVSLDNLETLNKSEILELKKPNQIYYKIYKAARRKAKKMRQKAVEAFLEAKQIKTKYMLQHLDDSDDSAENSDDDNYENNINDS